MNAIECKQAMDGREGEKLYTLELTGAEIRALADACAAAMDKMDAWCGDADKLADAYPALPRYNFGVFRFAQAQLAKASREVWKDRMTRMVKGVGA